MSIKHTTVLIIGSGPAGYTAAIYAARGGILPVLFTGHQIGGQLLQTTEVENFPGFPSPIMGVELMERMKEQALAFQTEIVNDAITCIDTASRPFKCLSNSIEYTADTIILATGATAKWLNVRGETELRGYGISGCATCDGFFFRGQHVVVIGGGNTAAEDALFLTNHAAKVTLIHRRNILRAEKILIDRLVQNDKIDIIYDTVVEEFVGQASPKTVTGVIVKDITNGQKRTIDTNGVFVAIGHAPQTSLVKGILLLDDAGYVITKPGTTETSVPGIFAAGDVMDPVYRQAITAAGAGCMAAMDVIRFLRENEVAGKNGY
ncbi:MAG: thioredoxin-disulfide reductase [Holosporales bacterium]|jgi:thioredoxin reductase (NADPH)|nr:thioredoxin-disulfide reductase [Holosporales bacterium]